MSLSLVRHVQRQYDAQYLGRVHVLDSRCYGIGGHVLVTVRLARIQGERNNAGRDRKGRLRKGRSNYQKKLFRDASRSSKIEDTDSHRRVQGQSKQETAILTDAIGRRVVSLPEPPLRHM